MGWLLTEAPVDLIPRVPKGSQGAGGHASAARGATEPDEGFEDCGGPTREEVLVMNVDEATHLEEVVIQRPWLGWDIQLAGLRPNHSGLQVGQQHGGDLAHKLGRAVVALHQGFALAFAGCSLKAHAIGHHGLKVEDQPILSAASSQVELCSNGQQHLLLLLKLAGP